MWRFRSSVASGYRHSWPKPVKKSKISLSGYQVVDGFEVEQDYYNFERMNLPKDHPARDMQDTFYITEEIFLPDPYLPVQARAMDAHDFSKWPLKMTLQGVFPSGYRWCDPQPPIPSDRRLGRWEEHLNGRPFKERFNWSCKKCLVQNVKPSSSFYLPIYRAIGRGGRFLLQMWWSWITYVRKLVGLKSWGAGMVHHASLRWSGIDQPSLF